MELSRAGEQQPRCCTGSGVTIFILCSSVPNIWNSDDKDLAIDLWSILDHITLILYICSWSEEGRPPPLGGREEKCSVIKQDQKEKQKIKCMQWFSEQEMRIILCPGASKNMSTGCQFGPTAPNIKTMSFKYLNNFHSASLSRHVKTGQACLLHR